MTRAIYTAVQTGPKGRSEFNSSGLILVGITPKNEVEGHAFD